MKYKGRKQSTNVEDMRGSSSGRSIGLKGGIVGTLAIALVVYLLGGNPMDVLQSRLSETEVAGEEVALSEKEQEMTEFVSVVLADTEEVWGKIFKDYGTTYRQPKLVLFRNSVSSACGYAQSATGPFYCPGDEKVYLDLDYLEALQRKLGATGDFAVAYIIAHEIGHHVQLLMGTMNEVTQAQNKARSQNQVNDLTVKLELQADFFAGVWIHHAQKMFNILEQGDLEEALNAASAVGDDHIQKQTQGYVTPDSFTHGTSAQRKSWLAKGIQTGDIRQGDTFKSTI